MAYPNASVIDGWAVVDEASRCMSLLRSGAPKSAIEVLVDFISGFADFSFWPEADGGLALFDRLEAIAVRGLSCRRGDRLRTYSAFSSEVEALQAALAKIR